jgi:phenylacetic acid degradation operon negative regulatory protein
MPSETLATLIDAYVRFDEPRVWSLLVSLFGDLAQSEGAEIDGPVLSAIMGAMQIKPEATRVALYRLRKGGWILSRRVGRMRRHSLSPHARDESLAASRRIYAPPVAVSTGWQVIILEGEGEDAPPDGFTRIAAGVFVGASDLRPPDTAFVLYGAKPPSWIRSRLSPAPLKRQYGELEKVLARTRDLVAGSSLGPRDSAVLRCLIVHNWRRLILKHTDLPRELYEDDWMEPVCRAHVTDLLARIQRPEMSEITAS